MKLTHYARVAAPAEWLASPVRCQHLMRRFFIAIVVLSISGALPLMASVGVCATTPCCRAHTASDQSIAAPSCCKETTCASATPDVQATNQVAKILVKPPVAAVLVAALPSTSLRHAVAEQLAPGSPPAQQRRLAVLSTLLV
ncbi:MAG TPA: hypothetical protein VNN25_22000 [Thermoanaerobaculia bacterium]|nr:hypothetical protein [Thermoanaerobaculia bacterium]